jgi:putative glycosyltransferase (TIGR04372 family)
MVGKRTQSVERQRFPKQRYAPAHAASDAGSASRFPRHFAAVRRIVADAVPKSERMASREARIIGALHRLYLRLRQIGRALGLGFVWRYSWRLGHKLMRFVYGHRLKFRPAIAVISRGLDKVVRLDAAGNRLPRLASWLAQRNFRYSARCLLFFIRLTLVLAIQVHLGAGQFARAFKTARILNLLFRPMIRARFAPTTAAYYQTFFFIRRYEVVARDFREHEKLTNFSVSLMAGIAHLQCLNVEAAKAYLSMAAQIDERNHLPLRMLGRAHLLAGDYDQAASMFQRSIELYPSSVMAHQNYAGGYDIDRYRPKGWELASGGHLLIYDNLIQIAEELFLQGRSEDSFLFYNKALAFQAALAKDFKLGSALATWVSKESPKFDADLPVRILPYEWVTQFGHIGLLDSYKKMAALGIVTDGAHVLLAPRNKVSNAHYLAYWDPYFNVIRNEDLVEELFPYQRFIGDQFMALASGSPKAEPWTRAAARAQVQWAEQGRAPLLELKEEDRAEGMAKLRELGLPDGAWFVGLHVREGGFYGDGSGTISEHRSAEIEPYFAAIREIVSRGGWVIRLGDSSMKPLPEIANTIDYARSTQKSKQMDIFLLAASRFVIGTTSGLSTVAMTFGTPTLLVNCISNDWQIWTADTDFVLKRVYSRRTNRYLSLAETYREPVQGLLINYASLTTHGYEIHGNAPEEIRAAVHYKLDVMLGKTARADDAHPLMKRYRDAMALNPYMFGAARPALPFLEASPELLEPVPGKRARAHLESEHELWSERVDAMAGSGP